MCIKNLLFLKVRLGEQNSGTWVFFYIYIVEINKMARGNYINLKDLSDSNYIS